MAEGGEGSGTSKWEFVEFLGVKFVENNKSGHQLQKKKVLCSERKVPSGRRLLHMSVTLEM